MYMSFKKLAICLIVLLILALSACSKQEAIKRKEKYLGNHHPERATVSPLKHEMKKVGNLTLQQSIRDYLENNKLNGTVAVVNGNRILFNDGVGYADFYKKRLDTNATTYPIGSITKTFVATSIMQLQDQGRLTIHDPISKFIPGFPEGRKLQLYYFLTHTSGIQAPLYLRGDKTPFSLIKEIERRPLKFTPGTRWEYLDANYMVLGYVVEKVSGMGLEEYIQTHIFNKAAMKDSGFITSKHPLPYNSVSYRMNGNKPLTAVKYLSPYSLFGCGDIYTTAYDLTQYDQALMGGRLISAKSLGQVLTPSGLSSYGLGLYNKQNRIFSIGVLAGWYSMHSYYPDKTDIVVLLNARNKTTEIGRITADIYQIIKSKEQQAAPNKTI